MCGESTPVSVSNTSDFTEIQRSRQLKQGTNQRERREKNHFKVGLTMISVTTPSSVTPVTGLSKGKIKKRVGKMFVEVRAAVRPDGNNAQAQGAQRSQA